MPRFRTESAGPAAKRSQIQSLPEYGPISQNRMPPTKAPAKPAMMISMALDIPGGLRHVLDF